MKIRAADYVHCKENLCFPNGSRVIQSLVMTNVPFTCSFISNGVPGMEFASKSIELFQNQTKLFAKSLGLNDNLQQLFSKPQHHVLFEAGSRVQCQNILMKIC